MTDFSLDIDLYQARMLIAFYKSGMHELKGTMEGFTRSLPPNRNFMIVCGIDRINNYLQSIKITSDTISTLKEVLPEVQFTDGLCNYLTSINFSEALSVRAMKDYLF